MHSCCSKKKLLSQISLEANEAMLVEKNALSMSCQFIYMLAQGNECKPNSLKNLR